MDVSVYGEVASEPDAEGEREWLAVPGMNLGRELTAGDFDGDGACDLAANARRPNATGQDAGFVAIFRGVAATDTDRGGVEEHAGLRISGLLDGVTNGQLGRFIRMADLDDDGKDDLILAHYNAPVLGENSTGMVYVIPGQRLSAEPAYEDVLPVDMASSTLLGPGTSAEFGRGLDVGDTNGDGRLDIIVGAPRAGEPESGINRAGGVFVYQQGDLGVPPEPSSTIWGIERDQRFGHAVRAIGSLGIGRGTSVMALSGYTYTQGVRIPAPRRLNLMTSEPGEEMSTPGVGAGAEFGRAVLFPGDINGDGFPDLVLGAHREARIRWNGRRGAAHIYLGTAEGLPSEPSMQLADFPHHGGDFSIRMMPAGDFNGDGNPDYAVLASGANRPNITDTENFLVADDCSSNPGRGVVHIFLGTASGSPAERPAFMLVGPETGRGRISHILGGVDTDGDDLDDVIVSSQDWRNTPTPTDPPPDEPVMQYGGFAVYRGNLPDPSGRIVVLCEPNHIEFGPDRDTDFGGALAPIGDLDGDGCEDFAVGDSGHDIPLAEDAFITNVGSVSVFFGFDGPTCLESSPRSTRFVGRAQFGSAGSRLAGGADLDGDGLNELLVGSFAFRDSEGQRGRVYLMRGDYIRSVAMSGTSDAPIVDPTSSQRLMLAGQEPGADFGLGLALLPNLGVEAGPGIAVGARRSGLGAAPLSGGVYIHRYTEAGLDQAHAAVIAGDESATESLLGEWIATSPTTPPMLGVSARMSSASYAGVGSAYVFPLTP
jgi:hypothetical protein